ILIIGGMSLVGMYRYYHNLPEGFELRPDTPLDRRIQIANAANITEELAEQLSQASDRHVRYELASHLNLGDAAIENLLQDPDTAVRKRIIRNLSIPMSMLEDRLDKESNASVKATIEETLRYRKDRQSNNGRQARLDADPRLRITEALELLSPDS